VTYNSKLPTINFYPPPANNRYKIWFTSLQCFRSYQVHKISTAIIGLTLTFDPVTFTMSSDGGGIMFHGRLSGCPSVRPLSVNTYFE